MKTESKPMKTKERTIREKCQFIIVNWCCDEVCEFLDEEPFEPGGSRYTLHEVMSLSDFSCFSAIDAVGDCSFSSFKNISHNKIPPNIMEKWLIDLNEDYLDELCYFDYEEYEQQLADVYKTLTTVERDFLFRRSVQGKCSDKNKISLYKDKIERQKNIINSLKEKNADNS